MSPPPLPPIRARACAPPGLAELAEFAGGAAEFVVLVARRDADGNVAIVGAIEDAVLTDKVLAKTVI